NRVLDRDRARDVFLEREQVALGPVVVAAPDPKPGSGVDEADRCPHAIAYRLHAPFDEIAHPECLPDGSEVGERSPTEPAHGAPALDLEASNLAEPRGDLLGQTVGEVEVGG